MIKMSLFAALVVLSLPAASLAEDHTVSVQVTTSDLDLSTAQGRERLDRRVRSAVNVACDFQSRALAVRVLEQDCRRVAFAQAKPQQDVAIVGAENRKLRLAAHRAGRAGA